MLGVFVVSNLQNQIKQKGEEILQRMEGQSKGSIFSKDFWYGRIMEWSMKNESFKTRMFRFVDVLPTLSDNNDVASHLKEYFTEGGEEMPSVFNVGLGLGSLAPSIMAGAIRKNVTQMAKMFITGESPEEALPVLLKARKQKICATVDLLGEATLGEKEAQQYQQKYLELITWLAKDAQKWDEVPQIDRDHAGSLPKVNVSVKLSALYSQINDKAWDHSKNILKERLRPLMQTAKEKNVFLNFDMEQYSLKELTLEVFKELLMEPEFRDYPFYGCVIQAYLRDSFKDVRDMIDFAKARKTPVTVRLVKGAYWDYETIEAEQRAWPIPVYTNKAESDANYEACAGLMLENWQHLRAAFASHNVRTISAALCLAEAMNVPKLAFEIQMLYGMGDPIKKSLVDMGYRVREYAPIGELIPGMAYLVRRLLENTSNESWLRNKFAEGQSTEQLLKDPASGLVPSSSDTLRSDRFQNEALLDFAVPANRNKVQQQVAALKQGSIATLPLWINGKEVFTENTLESRSPSNPDQLLSKICLASEKEAIAAVESAHQAYGSWKNTAVAERAKLLNTLADLMVRDRFRLIAEQVLEVGKPWVEADGDVAEAIDFCRYYARSIDEVCGPRRVGKVPGELSIYHYQARGVALVIAPWNFPLAILTGQVAAALVTGNTVVIKPAEQSSLVAHGLLRLLREAGFPPNSYQFIPGIGEQIGPALVKHPHVTTIAFTGSKAVGLEILRSAATVLPGQVHVKRCIIEMGGKNAIIVDSDADLDEAVKGVVYSAFGFAGQKCSACSRVFVVGDIYEKFKERLIDAVQSLKVLPSEDPLASLGPVIDQESQKRIFAFIESGKNDGRLLYQGPTPEIGHFVGPTIIEGLSPKSHVGQNEIFGPVLALFKVESLQQAVQFTNDVEYALTGGIFSRSPANIEYAKNNIEVGNLYVNRGITGALVDRHPFGGFKMSGIGSKTGGPDYLKQFMEPRTVTENTLRRGFAPTE
jgi:RHH-type proline utilization regulon transcriptional repressor/proline dehydrogenase/delta 1-pyrroline-5-carboxylate dehydrogenase